MRILAGEWGDNRTEEALKQDQHGNDRENGGDTTGEMPENAAGMSAAEAPAAGNGEPAPAPEADLAAELEKYKAQAEEYLQLLQRVQADFDNFRRRTAQEREEWSKYCSMRLVTNLLPVLDNFERALKSEGQDIKQFLEGMELIHKQLKAVLAKEGVQPIDALGKEFDPNFHEAVMQAPSEEYPDNTVMEELQKGYLLADRVIRPAMVKVAKS